jgi:TRAP-type C4-dicarboxylate transport system permease small subunit
MASSKAATKAGHSKRPPSIWKRVDCGFSVVARAIELTLGIAFTFAVVLNFATAADRYVFKRSIIGSDEIQIYIMIWMTFVGAAVVTWRHQHLRMDVLVSRFPGKIRLTLLGAELVLIVVLMAVLTSQSAKYALLMQAIDRRSDLAGLPMWVPHIGLAVGFGLIGLMTLWRMVELLASRAEPEDHPSDARI